MKETGLNTTNTAPIVNLEAEVEAQDNNELIDAETASVADSGETIMIDEDDYCEVIATCRGLENEVDRGDFRYLELLLEPDFRPQSTKEIIVQYEDYHFLSGAARYGRLDLIHTMWEIATPEMRSEMPTARALLSAAEAGHLMVVKTLLAFASGDDLTNVLAEVASTTWYSEEARALIASYNIDGSKEKYEVDAIRSSREIGILGTRNALLEPNILPKVLVNIIESYISDRLDVFALPSQMTAPISTKASEPLITLLPTAEAIEKNMVNKDSISEKSSSLTDLAAKFKSESSIRKAINRYYEGESQLTKGICK